MPDGMRGKKRLGSWRKDLATRCAHASGIFPPGARSSMYSPEYFAQVRDHNPYERHTQ